MLAAPTLTTPRLVLVAFDERLHLHARYAGWLGDADVVRYSEQRHRRHSVESCRAFVRSFADSDSILWAIEQSDGHHIGNLHADIDAANAVADVAILIGEKSTWGRGFGGEAWIAAVEWLLGPGGMRKVSAGCMAANSAMHAIMVKSGMVADGRRTAHFVLDGGPVDAIHMARFRDG